MVSDADSELWRRRERGRRSQAAFRKRQAVAAQQAADQSEQVREAVVEVLGQMRGDERPELLASVAKLAEIAGVDGGEAIAKTLPQGHPPRHPSSTTTIPNPPRDYRLLSTRPAAAPLTPTIIDVTSTRQASEMWSFDPLHYTRISLPPQDLVPYVGSRTNTLASHLFWWGLDHFRHRCDRPHPDMAITIRRGLSHSMATKDIGVGFIKAMVMARLEYIHTGVISPRLAAAAEPDLPSLVHKRVLEDYAARGEDPSLWLSPEGVEAHLGIKGGKMALAQLERAARGEEEPGLCEFLRQAMCRLSDMPVCFGDGPRWHVDVVDDVFADWALYIG